MKTKYLLQPFSYIFHPIFISIYGAVLYFLFTKNISLLLEVYLSFIQIFILTILLPISFYMLLKALKKVKSFTEATIEERRLPIFIQIILLYILLNFTVLEIHFPELYKFFQAGFISSFLVFVSVMLRFKTSLHMIGITSLFVFVVMLTSYLEIEATYTIAYLIMCVGFVASSRLYMKAHTPIELIAGMFIGALPQVFVWFYSM
ncbi:hypothetical protein G6N05_11560 [Flavobacterium sp. F372]|uniref:Phosphatase PAP2 family protein n=1 Tax=Flavobacterium bernardetii TaxID=2813823 RepID=A0ABR7IZR5_9FLAO|nr:hypothetical protein [Flavobacterium bernardetii]MBC5835137.1 hypothetical protein [Flavobacterium bernardetii]NHF70747.1 hypothetical protein [Flavobacterium bernardetii]